ncbi:c-type cytochrome [Agrobacterium tumefaciens]|uniref:Thiol oxidoreductase n=1 Tax=Agrobacterium tumefaciens TaxID=358 RepID=A0A2L2L7S8_AGRTU|nr:di-heme oxidoredictase family protein [Agrobacterium tumefaciens]AVH40383.1 thiol oxidoreductase [Agrobacterium tumefaciens]NSY94356.1 c-type cytochrome [Agrobacterium tumefaciens]NSZ02815.1 c-type cytochrome [Agrobacterium tumefaciens]NSZ41017.1 c-type cytochrome [Agrobacterium tumefaciens]NTB00846.1 c-type cytochrome [Agrobacterium tumefaciens]
MQFLLPPIRKPFFFAGAACLVASMALAEPLRNDLTEKDRSRVLAVTAPTADFTRPEPFEAMSGGATTSTSKADSGAFSHPSATMPLERKQDFKLGNALFQKLWVSSPSSTQASDGLGPLFNARSCQTCHVKDGRGRPPFAGEDAVSLFLRLARPARNEAERQAIASHQTLNFPDETYGRQLQNLAIPGLAAEGKPVITYTEEPVQLADGEVVMLRKPSYAVENLQYGPLGADTTLSARIAMPTLGLGLIEAIAEADILARADPDDNNGDGIAGRPAWVKDHRTGEVKLGRFGWKAQNASVRDQSASAFSHDIGISSPDAPNAYGDCTGVQKDCLAMPTGVQLRLGPVEAPDPVLDLVTFYTENLAVPRRRNVDDPTVLRGKQLFYASGCTACHTPKFVTRRDTADPMHSFQLIWPYSDFLLHDMGEGLADGQQVGEASGRQWRTQPLWGIGLTQKVNGNGFYLHDGRARSLTEAILWHGGEGQKARDAFAALQKSDRQALLAFLESL